MDFNITGHIPNVTPVQAHLISWDELGPLCASLLSGYLKRPILVGTVGDDYNDSWSLDISENPLTKQELASLLDALDADDYDWDANDFGEYPIMELSQALGQKLARLVLLFAVDESHAVDGGVWFTGKTPSDTVRLLIQYPEVDCTPDILTVPLDGEVTKEAVIAAFRHAMRFDNPEMRKSMPSRLERLDLIVIDMEITLKVKIGSLSIDAVGDIRGD